MKALGRDLRAERVYLVYEEHKRKRQHEVCQEEELAKRGSQL